MSYRLHATKNKHLNTGDDKYYSFEVGRGKDRTTIVKQMPTPEAAAIYDAELKRAHRPCVSPRLTARSFDDMLPDFLDYYRYELERRPRAIESWLQGWKNLKPYFGKLKPNYLTQAAIEQYKLHRLQQKAGIRNNLVSKRTVQKELHNLSSFVKYAVDKNLCDPLPFKIKGFAKKTTQAAPVIPPTPEQIDRLFNAIKHTECLDLYKSYYYTGARNTELRELKRKHVYLEWGIITFYGKGGKWRIVPIVTPLREIMERLCSGKQPEDYLFISKRTGKPFGINVARLDIAAQTVGIQTHITAHVLRKCFSTHAIHWGCDMRTLQLLLGHAEVTTTERYTFLPPSILQDKLAAFGHLPNTSFGRCPKESPDNYDIIQIVAP